MTYRWLVGMADVLRANGLTVVEHDGWKTRGRPSDEFDFNPKAVVMHHDASAEGPTPGEPDYIIHGRPPLDPGPLAQLWVSYYGVWHVLAAGRANHAGVGHAWGAVSTDEGNRDAVGVEWDHTIGETVPPLTRASIVTGLAALLEYLHADPETGLLGHLEYTTRKLDPDSKALPMGPLRADVKRAMHAPEDDDMPSADDVAKAVWTYKVRNPLTTDPNDTMSTGTVILGTRVEVHTLAQQTVDKIAAAVAAALPPGGITAEAIAQAVVQELGKELTD